MYLVNYQINLLMKIYLTKVIQKLKITAYVKYSGWGNHCQTIPCTVNIRHEIIFVANRLTGNLPVNGIG